MVKYIDEFRDGELGRGLAAVIARAARRVRPERRVAIGSRTRAMRYTCGRYQA